MSAVLPAGDGLGGNNDGSIDSSSSSGGESMEDAISSATDDDVQQGADHDASTPAARVRNLDDDMPEPRQHAYLPGASHPLYPEEWIGRSGVSRHGQHESPAAAARADSTMYDPTPPTIPAPDSAIIELPILELDDVILFPGCAVPLRLRHPGWVEYLGRRIDEARFGFGAGGDTNRPSNPDQQQVRIGVMMRMRETRRRTRMRRLREAPDESDVSGHGAGRARQGRWRVESLRRGVVRRREPGAEQEEQERASDGNDTEDDDAAQSNAERPRRQRDNDSGPSSFLRPRQPEDPRIGRIGTVAIVTYTHEVAGESTAANDEVRGNGDGADDSPPYRSRVWLRHSGQLVMTAMGTARFKILSRIDTGSTTLDAEQRVHPEMFRGDMADIKLYAVELLVDENLPLPPIRPLLQSSMRTSEDGVEENAHCGMIEYLSRITPMPSFAYNSHWPWKLVQEICKELSDIPAWEGLWKSLPPSSGHTDNNTNEDCAYMSNQADPLAFAFWMASNMPLSIFDRLDMLELDCNVERLRLILVKVAQQRQLERPIRCKQCGETITTISSLFTIGGAEGTTGAYVNEYGIVHQTQTVRTVDADHVFCVGNRESRDSWFSGYTWTIMHCATCAAHLGWKFDAIRGPTERTEDRPKRFFGLTGGAVTTEESSAPRRFGGGPGSVAGMMNVVRLQAIQGMAAEDDRADANGSEDSEADGDEDSADEEAGSD